MNIFKRIFTNKEVQNNRKANAENKINEPVYDYGLNGLQARLLLSSGDYGWNCKENSAKYILTNVGECREKISVWQMVSAWRGTGHVEWEALLAIAFVQKVVTALEQGESEADISDLFNRDLTASDGTFSQQQIYDHLIKWFDIEEQNSGEVRMQLRLVA